MERYLHSGTYASYVSARRRVWLQLRLLQLLAQLLRISIYLLVYLTVNIWPLYCLVQIDYSLCSRRLINLLTQKAPEQRYLLALDILKQKGLI